MDFVKKQTTKAAETAADTANWIKEVAANILEKASSNLEEFRDTVEDNPLYLGLLGITVFVLYLGIYFIYTRQHKRSEGEVRDSTDHSKAADQAGDQVDSYVDKAKNLAADINQWIKDTVEWIKEAAAMFKEKFEKFLDTAKDNPIYLGLIGVAVFVLSLGIYFIYTGDCDNMLDYVKEKTVEALDIAANIANWIKDVTVNFAIWIKDVTVNFAIWVKEAAVNFAIWIKDVTVSIATWMKEVAVSLAVWMKKVAANSLDIVKENPIFFIVLVGVVFVLCLVAYFIYTRQSKNREGKVATDTSNKSTSNSKTSNSGTSKNTSNGTSYDTSNTTSTTRKPKMSTK